MLLFVIGSTATQVILLILSLSILIILHEMGHFIPAKLFGTKVHKFYLFFDFLFPFPNIGNFSLFKKKIGDTEYGIGWFPFGGYVQIAGMADETQDAEALKNSVPQPWEFRSKPAWQRLIIMIGGVTVNMVLAMVIFAGLLWKYGEEYLPMANMKNGITMVDSLGYNMGLQDGDKIIAIDHKPAGKYEDFMRNLMLDQAKSITINRNGQQQDIILNDQFSSKLGKVASKKMVIFAPRIQNVVGKPKEGGALQSGIQPGDTILSVNGIPTPYYPEMTKAIGDNKGKMITVAVSRKGQLMNLKGKVSNEGKFGMEMQGYDNLLQTEKLDYNLIGAIPAGIDRAFGTLGNYFKGVKMLFAPKGPKLKDSVGGFDSIRKMFPDTFNWEQFWVLTATISVILAFMNILPIPMLDGGYVLFLLYEMVRGKPVSDRVQHVAQSVGLFLILGLLLFANGMDIIRHFLN